MRPNTLPVAELDQTLASYLTAVAPLQDPVEHSATRRAVAEFAREDGPACQSALQRFAADEDAVGRSWLSDAWLDAYLDCRTPLPLTSNVGFQLTWPAAPDPLDRAADVVHTMAAVHLAWLRGHLPPETHPRGVVLCDQQWDYLAGGLREPLPGKDAIRPGPMDAAHREIVVLRGGHAWAVPISDDAGRPLSRPVLRAALARIEPPSDPGVFTDPSYADNETAAARLEELRADPANVRTYNRLADALFAVNLIDERADVERHLERTTFGRGQAWTFKPVTYQISCVDDFLALHVEHTTVDGATVKASVAHAQVTAPDDTPGEPVDPEPLTWSLSASLSAALAADASAYDAAAAPYTVEIRTVGLDVRPGISLDAVAQLTMLTAQLATYGRVRSTYESVDMREFQAGRTECLRPNTPDAVAFGRSLLAGTATPEGLAAALAAHRGRVKACKAGRAIDRHLYGLAFVAERLGRRPALFADPGYRTLTTEWLSTTSLGDTAQLTRYAFAPATPDGFGINYTPVPGGFEFLVSYRADRCEQPAAFLSALTDAAALIAPLVGSAGAQ